MSTHNYIVGDSRNIEGIFKKNNFDKVDLIITSPPYFNVKNYENAKNQIGYKQNYRKYLDDLTNVFQHCFNIAKDNSTLWIVVDTIRKNGQTITLPFDIINKFKEKYGDNTWILRDIIIWNKHKNIPWHSKGRFKNQFEYVLFLSKNNNYKFSIDKIREIADYKKWWLSFPERYNSNGKAPNNVWEFTIPIRGWGNGYQKHLCPFPFPLIERIISLSSEIGDVVFDPFAGSGSVLALAKKMGRVAMGIDINELYKSKFKEEVLIGAQKYWNSRKKELNIIKKNFEVFKILNIYLRKIKSCIQLSQIINKFYSKEFLFLSLDKKNFSNDVELILINDSLELDNLNERFSDEILEISREFKININLKPCKNCRIFDLYPDNMTLYEYYENKIYKFQREILAGNFTKENFTKKGFYSNIKLYLNKDVDLLKIDKVNI